MHEDIVDRIRTSAHKEGCYFVFETGPGSARLIHASQSPHIDRGTLVWNGGAILCAAITGAWVGGPLDA